jgi:microcompartment protein CcmK/EutM
MIIARVVGNVVSTEKHPHYKGRKILVVQPITPDGQAKGASFLAVDGVQAGVGDTVLVVDEGGSARLAVGDEGAVTIRTAICGIVDSVDVAGEDAVKSAPSGRDPRAGTPAGGAAPSGRAPAGPTGGSAPTAAEKKPPATDKKNRRRP